MMKLLLGLSLLGNLILGYQLWNKKPEKEIIERVIIETHAENKNSAPEMVDTRKVIRPDLPKSEKKKAPTSGEFFPLESAEIQEAGEKMENEKLEFMTVELGMTEEKISEHNRIRDDFYKKSSKLFQKNPMGELPFEDRRKLVDMEEKLHRDLEKLHGKKNWERYKKFREDYNKKGFKRQSEDNQPYLFMGL
jgi:hypothetical protein